MLPLSEVLLIVMGLVTVAIIVAGLCRSLPVPFTVVLVVVGMVLAWLADTVPALAPLNEFQLSPQMVFFVFLPALIFESGFTLDARQLIKDLPAVLVLAVPALLISTAIVGFSISYIFNMELMVALLFGALISATDPVAVVALFKEIGAPPRLNTLVEGESLLNDATAIVLVTLIIPLAVAVTAGEMGGAGTSFGSAIIDFLRVFLGGAVVGGLIGMIGSELLYRLKSGVTAVLAMSLVMAYASFIIAEHVLHVSGVMASASAAVALGVFGVARLRHEATDAIGETWELVALVCNSLLFLMIGMSVDIVQLAGRLDYIAVAIALVLAARAATVYTFVPATTRLFRLPKVSVGERHIMWWGGLKGGLAVAIVLSLPETLGEIRELLLHMTLGVVLFTLLVNAPTIRPLMSRLKMDAMTPDEEAELKHALEDAQRKAEHHLSEFTAADVLNEEAKTDIVGNVGKVLAAQDIDVPDQARREAFLVAVRAEMEALDEWYGVGVVTQYTYLDLRDVLQRDRERSSSDTIDVPQTREGMNLFMRLERALLRRLRERNWAAGLLSRYQRLRMTQHLEHNIAGILMATAGIHALEARAGLDADERASLIGVYQGRLVRRKARLTVIRRDFEEFYNTFVAHLSTKVALNTALHGARHQVHAGEIGAKAYASMERDLAVALETLPEITAPQAQLSAAHLIEMVPLFSAVSERALDDLAARAQTVTFLAGDDVIGEGERGNALYIVTQGTVSVVHDRDGKVEHLADLVAGDFFGEAAMLGDDVRTATVRAATPSTLLRLTRRDVLELARDNPDVERSLEAVRTERAS
jgi:monovalent cation:H+ antiporter, CPA1 family